ncbi:MAG: DUF3048 domain-containing protein [Anaerolineales bacterium]|nr:MAG: DUF3048 domain-containing protein [Anaerolineales bacterium]
MTRNSLTRPGTVGLVLLMAVVLVTSGCASQASRSAAAPDEGVTPTSQAEVVSFATAAPATRTPTSAPATPTPAPTPTPLGPTDTPVPRPATPIPTPTFPPRPENENPLTGLLVDDPAVLQRRPVHVRVGNDPGARPQVGLGDADLVYEEVVEWWVTRYTAVYLNQAPEMVAPIRSARLISTQLTQQYQAALVNSGGSDGVRWELSQLPIVNLDEYFWPQPYFYRENQGWQTRLAVNVLAAYQLMEVEEMSAAVRLRGFTFSDAPTAGEPAESIAIPYPKQTSPVDWRYDSASGRYLRWISDEPMLDFASNQQLSAANVVIYYAEHLPTDIVEDSNGATSIRIVVNGEGRAQVFRDGVVMEGLWRTDGTQTPEFVFPNGEPIPLKRGNSWIEVVPIDYEVLVQ